MLQGPTLVELHAALLGAFAPYEIDIAAANAGLRRSLRDHLAVPGTTFDQGLFEFLRWVDAQHLMVRFLTAARQANPGNPELGRAAAKVDGLAAAFAALRPVDEAGRSVPLEAAESIVLKGVRFEDIGPWLDNLGKIRRAVCRVEPQPQKESLKDYGSGYLVGPDVVMTNFHVAEGFWNDPARAARVRLRFDYETTAGGVGVGAGTEHALRTAWPAGEAATSDRPHPWQCLSSPVDELDFALLRLKTPAGADRIGDADRSYLTLTPRPFGRSDPVLIVQHPAAEPMKVSFGAVTDVEPNRVRYQVNTEGGSSGSPCLTQDLKVTGIHHLGLTDRNQAVTHQAILAFLQRPENRQRLQALRIDQYVLANAG